MTVYIRTYFKTKKALREAVQEGRKIEVYSESPMGTNYPQELKGEPIVGPGPYERKWYGQVDVSEGIITKVK